MTRLTDGNKTVEISMNEWTGNGYTLDWSADFFEVGGCKYNAAADAYTVQDVDYCVEQAIDWRNATGDFYEADADTDRRNVDVYEV